MDVQPLITWVAPIVGSLVTCAGQLALNGQFRHADEKRNAARTESDEQRRAEAEWREDMSAKVGALTDATQTTMRTTLLHYIEKYLERGWLTPEERASLSDMHAKYAALNANGLIDGYMARVDALPDKEI